LTLRIVPYLAVFTALAMATGHAQKAENRASESSPSSTSSSSQQKSSSPAHHTILKVGGKAITEEEFESTIGEIEPKGGDPDKGATEKDRRRLGEDYASVLMLSQLAVAEHLDSSPEVRQKLIVARMQVLSDAAFAKLLDETKPTPEELNHYYQTHLAEFDRVQVRRLFIWKVGEGSKNSHGLSPEDAKARAAAILQASASGADALQLAEMFKESDKGIFDAQPLTFVRGQLSPTLDKVAFTAKPGTWAQAEDTPDHIILMYLMGRERPPLSEVTSLVEKTVQGEKMQAKLDELKKKTGIWMDESYFGKGSSVAKGAGEQQPVSNPPKNEEEPNQ